MSRFNSNTGRILAIALLAFVAAWFVLSGRSTGEGVTVKPVDSNSLQYTAPVSKADTTRPDNLRVAPAEIPPAGQANTEMAGSPTPNNIVAFAKTLLGVPYVYASSDPNTGFDCSGFITYVFKHFNIEVPRSSFDFSHVGKTIAPGFAKQGDLILFTGTDELERRVGHMGIVVSNDADKGIRFIHATSGKAMAVTISAMTDQYQKRFVRVCRVL